jgi:hypothetical protein
MFVPFLKPFCEPSRTAEALARLPDTARQYCNPSLVNLEFKLEGEDLIAWIDEFADRGILIEGAPLTRLTGRGYPAIIKWRARKREKSFQRSEKGKTVAKVYRQSEKGKTATKVYRQSEKGKLSKRVELDVRKEKGLEAYLNRPFVAIDSEGRAPLSTIDAKSRAPLAVC